MIYNCDETNNLTISTPWISYMIHKHGYDFWENGDVDLELDIFINQNYDIVEESEATRVIHAVRSYWYDEDCWDEEHNFDIVNYYEDGENLSLELDDYVDGEYCSDYDYESLNSHSELIPIIIKIIQEKYCV